MEKEKVKGNIHIQINQSILESFLIIKNMDRGFLHIQIIQYIMVISKMICIMDEGPLQIIATERSLKGFTREAI